MSAPPVPVPCNCRFYGYCAPRLVQVLVASGGNQCALLRDSFSPCMMEVNGLAPDWERCPRRHTHAEVAAELDSYEAWDLANPR